MVTSYYFINHSMFNAIVLNYFAKPSEIMIKKTYQVFDKPQLTVPAKASFLYVTIICFSSSLDLIRVGYFYARSS